MKKEDYKIAYENVMIANKMLEQENQQLKEDFAVLKKLQMISNDILNELEEYCKSWKENEKYCYLASNDKDKCRYDIWGEVLDKIQELKEKYK